ncbi:MAG TPA: NAD(P)/FAD-dependent oxidoreductase [Pyrinomonadaceae bacterium]|jgi:NADH dehydrogenase|nr:NAD(P)/FAD-dependent oxidoreductase [Pyrinomonadaceae bacterium]
MAEHKSKIVIIGGGFGGLFTALDLAGAGDVTLVSDPDHFLFRPMLYEYLSGEVEAWHIAPSYRELLDGRTEFVRAQVTKIDADAQTVLLHNYAEPLTYDVLVFSPGAITNYAGVEGAEEFTLPFRTLDDADGLRRLMTRKLDNVPPETAPQDVRSELTFAVVGGGASGVELSTKMAALLRDAVKRRALRGEPRVVIVEMADRLVPGMGEEIRQYVENALEEERVEIHTETRVVRVTEDSITLEHRNEQTVLQTAGVVWVAGVQTNPLVDALNVERDRRGLIMVEPTLQVRHRPSIFALGDVAFYPDVTPTLAGTAQLALQQAHLCARNVRALIQSDELKSKHFAELGEAVSLGTEHAAVLTGGKVIGGPLARQARFALYTARLPTWHHRLRVGASWFFEGTQPRPLQPLRF